MRIALTDADADAVEDRLLTLTGAKLVPSTDPRRELVLHAMAAVHAGLGAGWTIDYAREHVSVTLPAIPSALATLARHLPIAGELLGALGDAFPRTTILLSPAAEATPATRVAALCHEAGHALQIRDGGAAWCIAYALRQEHRALGAEAPCYAADLAWHHWTTGENPDAVADRLAASLASYGVGAAIVADARRVLASHVTTLREGLCPAVPTVVEAVRTLRARGVAGLPALP